jgi:four helix bundle protein
MADQRGLRAGSHRDLIVWQKAMTLAVEVNMLSRRLPADERYELARQMRTAALSIAANIAEGKGRNRRPDYARFIAVARGSARELETIVELTRRLAYLDQEETQNVEQLIDEVSRMLTVLLRRLTPL